MPYRRRFAGRSDRVSGTGFSGMSCRRRSGTDAGAGGLMTRTQYDFVIVGGGSAGSALANRLSADPSNNVLVLEAGRPDYIWDVFIHMPAALTFPIGSRYYDWKYESEPQPFMHGRRVYHPRGKGLGGAGGVHRGGFPRGRPPGYPTGGG